MTLASVRSNFLAPWVTNSLTIIRESGRLNCICSIVGFFPGTTSLAVKTFGRSVAIVGELLTLTLARPCQHKQVGSQLASRFPAPNECTRSQQPYLGELPIVAPGPSPQRLLQRGQR